MSRIRYTAEFKAEAIKPITERGHAVAEVATRLGISDKSLYVWLKQSQQLAKVPVKDEVLALKSEASRMKAELKRTTAERDIPKKAAAYFARVSE